MMSFLEYISEAKSLNSKKVSAPGYQSRNFYDIRFGPRDFSRGIQHAYDASNVANQMLQRTHEGKTEGIERASLPEKNGRSYEQHEMDSHQRLMRSLKRLGEKHGVEITHNDYSGTGWNDLEKKYTEYSKSPNFKSNLSETLPEKK